MTILEHVGLLASMHDFAGEGIDTAFDRIRDSGVTRTTVAVAYHTARDLLPHNPDGQVLYQEGGTTYFEPDLGLYEETPLKPLEADLTRGTDLLGRMLDRAGRIQLPVGAWLVALHNTRLAMGHPECAQETAGGDRLLHSLCPANPAVRAYALALIDDVASLGVDHLLMESLSYMPFDHGYHHERDLLGLDPRTRFLLGLCFCSHCLTAGEAGGVDVRRLRSWVAARIQRFFDDGHATPDGTATRDWAWEACDGELGGYLEARIKTVIELASQAARIATRSGTTEVAFIDPSGAMLGYATGRPASEDHAVDIGWRDGISVDRLASTMDIATTAYFASPNRLRTEIEGYLDALPGESRLHVILRPMPPDTRSADELLPKLEVLASSDIQVLSFYHYGLMRLESIEWIKQSLAQSSNGQNG